MCGSNTLLAMERVYTSPKGVEIKTAKFQV